MIDRDPEIAARFLSALVRRLQARGGAFASVAEDIVEATEEALQAPEEGATGAGANLGGLVVHEDPEDGLVVRLDPEG